MHIVEPLVQVLQFLCLLGCQPLLVILVHPKTWCIFILKYSLIKVNCNICKISNMFFLDIAYLETLTFGPGGPSPGGPLPPGGPLGPSTPCL